MWQTKLATRQLLCVRKYSLLHRIVSTFQQTAGFCHKMTDTAKLD